MTKPVLNESALAASIRDHAYLDYLVKRKGVLAFDPNTEAGKEIYELFDAFAQAANPRRDEIVRLQGVELAVEAVLIRRSLVTQIFQMRRFDPRQTKLATARRSTLSAALAGWNTASQQLERALKMMGIEGYAQIEQVTEKQDDLKALLKQKADQVRDAEFREVSDDAEASPTPAVDPAPPSYPSADVPSPASEVSSADADAPVSTPDPPAPRSKVPHPAVAAGLKMALALRQSSTSETQTATPHPDEPASDSPAILGE